MTERDIQLLVESRERYKTKNVRPADTSDLRACIVCKSKQSLREGAKIVCKKKIGAFTGHPSYDYVNNYLDVCDEFERGIL